MFDLDGFIADCVTARREGDSIVAVKEVLDRALAQPEAIADVFPATAAELMPLYTSPDMTILKVVWGPGMQVPPHDHLMWAVNGIYGGREDNVFYRRGPEGLVQSGGRRIELGTSAMLGADVIHSVTNTNGRACTGSIHIYGGDYMRTQRSVWDPDTLEESPADGDTIRRMFEEARRSAVQEHAEK